MNKCLIIDTRPEKARYFHYICEGDFKVINMPGVSISMLKLASIIEKYQDIDSLIIINNGYDEFYDSNYISKVKKAINSEKVMEEE